jgi:endonuclease III
MTPDDIPIVNRRLKRAYAAHKAPIVDLIKVETGDPFRILVATILSARTKDETTSIVCRRLFKVVTRPHDFDLFSEEELEKLIFPIGFFRTKAKHLKLLPAVLDRECSGVIPDTIDDLCKLPGVGRKTANLVVAMAFEKPAICVDVHVHRICNRLGLLKTKTPLETEMKLREILPKRYWITWNSILVSYGQVTCTPIGPHCSRCVIPEVCPRRGVKRSR